MLCYFNLNQNARHLPSGNSNAQYAPTYSCGCSLVVAMLIAACLIHHAPIGSCSENKEKKKRTNMCRTAYNSLAVRLKLVRDQQNKKLKIHICVNTWKLWLGINCSLLKGDTLVRKHWRWLPTEWTVRSRLQWSVVKRRKTPCSLTLVFLYILFLR